MPKNKRRVSRAKLIEQSLRDAQRVLSGYMASGGKQVSDTMGALLKIFESPKLGSALKPARRRRRSTRSGATRTAKRKAPKGRAAAARASSPKGGRRRTRS